MDLQRYGGQLQETCATSVIPATLSERLKSQKMELEKRLATINSALSILEENPKMQELMDIISRVY